MVGAREETEEGGKRDKAEELGTTRFPRASDCALQSKRPANINTAHVRWQQGQYRTSRANNRGCNTIYFPPPFIYSSIYSLKRKKEEKRKVKSAHCCMKECLDG